MAFKLPNNTNTYAPSMNPRSGIMAGALDGLLDRPDQMERIAQQSPFQSSATTAPVPNYPPPPQPQAATKPESRQSVWQYTSPTGTLPPITRSLTDDPAPPPAGAQPPGLFQAMPFQPTQVQIDRLDPLSYYAIQPVSPRGMV